MVGGEGVGVQTSKGAKPATKPAKIISMTSTPLVAILSRKPGRFHRSSYNPKILQ